SLLHAPNVLFPGQAPAFRRCAEPGPRSCALGVLSPGPLLSAGTAVERLPHGRGPCSGQGGTVKPAASAPADRRVGRVEHSAKPNILRLTGGSASTYDTGAGGPLLARDGRVTSG